MKQEQILLVVHICTVIINLYYYFGFRNQAKTVWDFLWRIVIAITPVISQIWLFVRYAMEISESYGDFYQQGVSKIAKTQREDQSNQQALNPVDEVFITIIWFVVVRPIGWLLSRKIR